MDNSVKVGQIRIRELLSSSDDEHKSYCLIFIKNKVKRLKNNFEWNPEFIETDRFDTVVYRHWKGSDGNIEYSKNVWKGIEERSIEKSTRIVNNEEFFKMMDGDHLDLENEAQMLFKDNFLQILASN